MANVFVNDNYADDSIHNIDNNNENMILSHQYYEIRICKTRMCSKFLPPQAHDATTHYGRDWRVVPALTLTSVLRDEGTEELTQRKQQ